MAEYYKIWSGIDTIGGNILEVQTDEIRLFTDFGLSSAKFDKSERSGTALDTLISQGSFPAIDQVFDGRLLNKYNHLSRTTCDKKIIVLISHLHLDHMGALQFLPAHATIYMSQPSKQLYESLLEVGEDFPIQAKVIGLDYNHVQTIADIAFHFKETDHDVIGASAIFIETPEIKLIHPDKVLQFLDSTKQWQADLLLFEGTDYSFLETEEQTNQLESEADLLTAFEAACQKAGLLVINPYIRNVERLAALQHSALKAGRKIIWEEKFASIIHAFYPDLDLLVLENDDNTTHFNRVNLELIEAGSDSYILQNSFVNLHVLKDLSGCYLHMNGEPLGDYDPHYDILKQDLIKNNFTYYNLGVSGHANKTDLLSAAQASGAKAILAWHTLEPKRYQRALQDAGLNVFDYPENHYFTKEDL